MQRATNWTLVFKAVPAVNYPEVIVKPGKDDEHIWLLQA